MTTSAPPPATPLSELRALARAGATGEFVCATNEAEIHVHLHEGRVAWATSTIATFGFSKYILAQCDIEEAAFRDLIEECRRHRKPFGETLVEWGLATEELIRDALGRQIRESLDGLRAAGPASFLFLPRGAGYRSYRSEFTFDLRSAMRQKGGRLRSSQRLPQFGTPVHVDLIGKLAELAKQEKGVRWIEYHGKGPVHRINRSDIGSDMERLGSGSLAEGVIFAALRGWTQTVIGLPLTKGAGTVWCGVDPDIVLGAMILMLRAGLPVAAESPITQVYPEDAEIKIYPDRGLPQPVLRELLARSPEVLAVGLSDSEGRIYPLASRSGATPDLADRIRAPMELLQVRSDDRRPYVETSIAIASDQGVVCGGRFLDESGRCIWLVLTPEAGQGLGWALTTALLRQTTLTPRDIRS